MVSKGTMRVKEYCERVTGQEHEFVFCSSIFNAEGYVVYCTVDPLKEGALNSV